MGRLSFVILFSLFIGVGSGCIPQTSGQPEAGWITLIDGEKGLENWNRIGEANWRPEEGAIVADKGGKGGGYLVSKDVYGDFQIRAEFWASHDANSGIFIRCADREKISPATCYEVNIFDQRPDPSYGTGAIVNFAKVSPMPKVGGRWSTYEITAKGKRLIVVLNGAKTVDLEDGKFARGPFALQYGAGVIKWRKVEIRPL